MRSMKIKMDSIEPDDEVERSCVAALSEENIDVFTLPTSSGDEYENHGSDARSIAENARNGIKRLKQRILIEFMGRALYQKSKN